MPHNDQRRCCLGIGISKTATIADAIALARRAMDLADVNAQQIAVIATIESRRGHPVLEALALNFSTGIVCFSAATLDAETPRLKNPSDTLFARIGCHGVAEAAALAAAGKDAELIVEKMASQGITMAIAI